MYHKAEDFVLTTKQILKVHITVSFIEADVQRYFHFNTKRNEPSHLQFQLNGSRIKPDVTFVYLTWIFAGVQVSLEAGVSLVEVDKHKETQDEQRQETVSPERHLGPCQRSRQRRVCNEDSHSRTFTKYDSILFATNISSYFLS